VYGNHTDKFTSVNFQNSYRSNQIDSHRLTEAEMPNNIHENKLSFRSGAQEKE